jgi:PAS domain S-box-containing protein
VENALLYEQILEQRNLAQNILESAPNGILTIDKNSVLQMINRKAEQLLKVKRRNVLDRNISTFLPDKMIEMVSDAIGYGKDYRYDEIMMNSKSGTPLIYGATSAILYGAQGNINGAIITIQDLTRSRKPNRCCGGRRNCLHWDRCRPVSLMKSAIHWPVSISTCNCCPKKYPVTPTRDRYWTILLKVSTGLKVWCSGHSITQGS